MLHHMVKWSMIDVSSQSHDLKTCVDNQIKKIIYSSLTAMSVTVILIEYMLV